MEDILPQLISFPPSSQASEPLSDFEYDQQIRLLVTTLDQTSASKLIGSGSNASKLLEVQDIVASPSTTDARTADPRPITKHNPYLQALLAHIGALKGLSPVDPLWQLMEDFIKRFDPVQIRYAGFEFRRLLDAAWRGAGTGQATYEACWSCEASLTYASWLLYLNLFKRPSFA